MMDAGIMELPEEVVAAARGVRLLIMDCDGVMTDGRLYFSGGGESMKVFHVRDGQGIASWHSAGFESGIISGRGAGDILKARAQELGMRYVISSSRDKASDLDSILSEARVDAQEVAYIGDDLGDISVMRRVGFPVAVNDAAREAKAASIFVTLTRGGLGAVREVTDLLLSLKGI